VMIVGKLPGLGWVIHRWVHRMLGLKNVEFKKMLK